MAPENIARPEAVDARTDLYSLGAVAYHLLTGTTVFEGNTMFEICAKHMFEVPLPPSKRAKRDVPEALESRVLGCLAKDAAERPRTARSSSRAWTVQTRSRHGRNDTENIGGPSAARLWWPQRAQSVKTKRPHAVPIRSYSAVACSCELRIFESESPRRVQSMSSSLSGQSRWSVPSLPPRVVQSSTSELLAAAQRLERAAAGRCPARVTSVRCGFEPQTYRVGGETTCLLDGSL